MQLVNKFAYMFFLSLIISRAVDYGAAVVNEHALRRDHSWHNMTTYDLHRRSFVTQTQAPGQEDSRCP